MWAWIGAGWTALVLGTEPPRFDWIGNSGGPTPGQTVPRTVTDCWIDRDGTAFLVAPPHHGEPSFSAFRNGKRIATPPIPGGFTIAGNRQWLFIADVDGIRWIPKPGRGPADRSPPVRRIAIEGVTDAATVERLFPDQQAVRGMLASDRHLLVSNAARQRVEVWALDSQRLLRTLDFERPGALALDAYEGLWVAREPPLAPGSESPPASGTGSPVARADTAPAALVRIDLRTGHVLEELPFAGIPVALLAVPRGEQGIPDLWVADNGPHQRIQVYSRRDSRRTRFLHSIAQPGHPPQPASASASPAPFHGLVGLGRALDGTVQVAQNGTPGVPRRADLRPRGASLTGFSATLEERLWVAQQVVGAQPAAIASTPPHRVYYSDAVIEVDWDAADGLPWHTVASTSDPLTFRETPAFRGAPGERSVHRVFERLLLFETEGPSVAVWRRDPSRHGDVWMPFAAWHADASWLTRQAPLARIPERFEAAIRREFETERRLRSSLQQLDELARKLQERLELQRRFGWIWTDGSGAQPSDGRLQEDEVESLDAVVRHPCWAVSTEGALWLAGRETGLHAVHNRPIIRHWTPERMDSAGLPSYRSQPPQAAPSPLAEGRILWMHHSAELRRMLLGGTTPRFPGDQPRWVGLYEEWPPIDPFASSVPRLANILRPGRNNESVDALAASGPLLFVLDAPARHVRVFDIERGNRVATLALEGALAELAELAPARIPPRTLTVRLVGDRYVVLLGAPQWDRTLAVRWRPSPPPSPLPPPRLHGWIDDQRIRLLWTTPDCGLIEGYHVERKAPGDTGWQRLTDAPHGAAFLDDTQLANGETYAYRVAIVGAGGPGPYSEPLRLVPAAPRVRFVGEDRETQGDWRGRYGTLGWALFGDTADPATPNPSLPPGLLRSALLDLSGVYPDSPDLRADPALPQRPGGDPDARPAGFLRVPDDEWVSFPIEVQDGRSLRLSLYCGSSERIHGLRVEWLNATATQVLETREFTNEHEPQVRGRYWSWEVTGSVLLRISAPRHIDAPDLCGLNALFFDAPGERRDP